jgi:hypothetical protein
MSSQRIDTSPAGNIFTKEVIDNHLTTTGQMTDDEVKDMVLKGNWKQHFLDPETFAQKVFMDDVSFDQMMAWVTTLFCGGSSQKSFDDVFAKIFKIHLQSLDIKSLLNIQYYIETRVKQLVTDNNQEDKV